MEDIIMKRIKKVTEDDSSVIYFFNINNDEIQPSVSYQDIELIYLDYINKYYLYDSEDESIQTVNQISFKLSIVYPELSSFLEDSFNNNINSVEDDFLLFYIKGESSLLILFKSFFILNEDEKISLPHHCIYNKNKKTIEILNSLFNSDEKMICVSCKG